MAKTKPDFSIDVRIGRTDGKPSFEIVSQQNQTDPSKMEQLNRELEQAAAKLQRVLADAYSPDRQAEGRGQK